MNDITQVLLRIESGQSGAADELLQLVYEELRKLAGQKLAQEMPGQTLEATALVNEAYLRLIGSDGQLSFQNRRHFYGSAARTMRQILVERARHRRRSKRGGDRRRVDFTDVAAEAPEKELVALGQALSELVSRDPVAAEVVDLHHFADLPYAKTAEILGISTYEVRRKWAFARAWLSDRIK